MANFCQRNEISRIVTVLLAEYHTVKSVPEFFITFHM